MEKRKVQYYKHVFSKLQIDKVIFNQYFNHCPKAHKLGTLGNHFLWTWAPYLLPETGSIDNGQNQVSSLLEQSDALIEQGSRLSNCDLGYATHVLGGGITNAILLCCVVETNNSF